MTTYKPIYSAEELILGTGYPIVVAGWTPKEKVIKDIPASNYAVVGNLFSAMRGLSILIRNVLANPKHNLIFILAATKCDKESGSCRCLRDFFDNGFVRDNDRWKVNSEILGYIDGEISEQALETLRKEVKIHWFSSLSDLTKELQTEHKASSVMHGIYREALKFPSKETTLTTFPGITTGHVIRERDLGQAWLKVLDKITTYGLVRETEHGLWQELLDLIVVLEEVGDAPAFAKLDKEFINNYKKQMLSKKKDDVHYTYGERMRSWFGLDQIEGVINKLADLNSSRAVISLWDATKDLDTKSPPCLNHIWFRTVEGRLVMTATLRSNDMYGAWVSNVLGLRAVQEYVLKEINKRYDRELTLGELVTISQSAHIYEHCWKEIPSLLKLLDKRVKYDDRVGIFLINYDHEIVVQWQYDGRIVKTFRGRSPLNLIREIALDVPDIEPSHIGYLGIELEKAKSLKEHYKQDK